MTVIDDKQAIIRAILGHVPENCTRVVLTIEVDQLPSVTVTQWVSKDAIARLRDLNLTVSPGGATPARHAWLSSVRSSSGRRGGRQPDLHRLHKFLSCRAVYENRKQHFRL